MKVSAKEIREMFRFRREGWSHTDIADWIGCSRSTVRYHLRRHKVDFMRPDELRNEIRDLENKLALAEADRTYYQLRCEQLARTSYIPVEDELVRLPVTGRCN